MQFLIRGGALLVPVRRARAAHAVLTAHAALTPMAGITWCSEEKNIVDWEPADVCGLLVVYLCFTDEDSSSCDAHPHDNVDASGSEHDMFHGQHESFGVALFHTE